MKNLVSSKRIIAIMTCVLISTVSVLAQTVKKHIVERGETVESIAEKYGVTKASIIEMNPDAAQFVYVGMELKIPEGGKISAPYSDIAATKDSNIPANEELYSQKNTSTKDLLDFSNYGAFYRAAFDKAGHGLYGLGGNVYSDYGIGFNFFLGANYGLNDSDYAGFAFFVGPCYGYNINNVLLSVSFDFVGQYMGQGKKQMEGTNKKGEKYKYTGTDSKFTWGLALTPTIGVKLNKITPYCGIDLRWDKETKDINAGFIVGVGFDI